MHENQSVTNQVGGGFMACVEDENAVLQQFGLAQLHVSLALNQPCQHVVLRVTGVAAAVVGQRLEVGGEISHRLVARGFLLGRQFGFERTQNRQRPAPQGRTFG